MVPYKWEILRVKVVISALSADGNIPVVFIFICDNAFNFLNVGTSPP